MYLVYTWKFEVDNSSLMIRKPNPGVTAEGAKLKTYLFNYYYIKTNYWDAVRVCKELGHNWDVASFQALFELKNNRNILNDDYSDIYLKSLRNIRSESNR